MEDAAWSIRLYSYDVLFLFDADHEKLPTLLWLRIAAIELAGRFAPCDYLPAAYIIVPVLSKKPSRKRHWGGRAAEG